MKRRSFWGSSVAPIIPLLVVGVCLEIAVRFGWVRAYLVPAPSNVLRAMFEHRSTMLHLLIQTAAASLIGFALSVVVGIGLAVVLSSANWIQRTFYPYAVFFQTVPIVAIAPLLVIWIGYDIKSVIASAFIVSVFPVIANTLTGLLSTDPALRDLFALYGAGSWSTLFKLRLPSALPSILTGLRIAAGLAVIGAIVGEFITGSGIGGSIPVAQQQQRVDLVFAGLLLATLLGILLFGMINLISHLTLRHWHASEAQS